MINPRGALVVLLVTVALVAAGAVNVRATSVVVAELRGSVR